MKNMIARFIREDAGQDLIEYALLAGFISLAAIAGITLVGTALDEKYDELADAVADAGAGE